MLSTLRDRAWLSRNADAFKADAKTKATKSGQQGGLSLTAGKAIAGLGGGKALVDEGDPAGLEVGRHSRNHRDLSERVASETRVVVRPGENGGAMESTARGDSTEKHSQRQRET